MKLIIDTDIGDDYDDVFTLAVALASPEVELLGLAMVVGDVALRARLSKRFLSLAGRSDVPVAIGSPTSTKAPFTHRRWAEAGPPLDGDEPEAVEFLLRAIASHPGEVTLLAIGPLSNLAAALARDAATFRRLRRIVLMGGSVHRGYRDLPSLPPRGPSAEYNIVCDIPAARAVFSSGVPLVVAPLDATLVALDELKRQALFTRSTPVTDALALTYLQWAALAGRSTPILFDTVALAQAIDPQVCATEQLRLDVDAEGYTRIGEGPPNAEVGLSCDENRFFRLIMPRLLGRP
jgi:purine nucleosidase